MNKKSILSLGLLLFLFGCCDDCDSNGGSNSYNYVNDTSDTLNIVVMRAYDYSVSPPIRLSQPRILSEYQIFPGDSLIAGPNGSDFNNAPFVPFNESQIDSVSIALVNITSSIYQFSCISDGDQGDCEVVGNPINQTSYHKIELSKYTFVYTYLFGDYFGD